jgi:hypothetical protein
MRDSPDEPSIAAAGADPGRRKAAAYEARSAATSPPPVTLSAPTREKLAKIILRLGSKSDGEVVATVKAMERLLRSDGMSFDELAEAVRQPGALVLVQKPRAP